MHQRKVPLFIHVDPMNPVVLGYTCRYCPDCDLLVAHQDEIEELLANLFAEHDPSIVRRGPQVHRSRRWLVKDHRNR